MVNGALLTMPFLEPYLIKTMKKAYQTMNCEQLRKEMKIYMQQEGRHYQQHRKFNNMFINKGHTELQGIDVQMKADFAEF